MSGLFRDTFFGHVLRYISGQRLLPYEEDKDPSIWQKYVHKEKTARIARQGHTGEGGVDEEKDADTAGPDSAGTGSPNGDQDGTHNEVSGVKVDPEKGKDVNIIDWFGPDDPEVIYPQNVRWIVADPSLQNPLNWSTGKKFFVTFEICLLTFSVYIGSAIYSAGEVGVEERFHVSQVAATLGLSTFVGGYGLGPMIWYVLFSFCTVLS